MTKNTPTAEATPCLYVDGGKVTLKSSSDDALFSARSHAWREVLCSIKPPKNQFGQSYRAEYKSYSQIQAYKQRLVEERGIPEIEAELLRRGLELKNKNYTRVSARFATF